MQCFKQDTLPWWKGIQHRITTAGNKR